MATRVCASEGARSRSIHGEALCRSWVAPQQACKALCTALTSELSSVNFRANTQERARARMHCMHALTCRDGFSNIVWSTTPEHAAQLEKMGPEDFGAAVGAALALGAEAWGGAGAAGGLAGLLSRAAGSAEEPRRTRTPPEVHSWVGKRPASFPLAMQHAGRFASSPSRQCWAVAPDPIEQLMCYRGSLYTYTDATRQDARPTQSLSPSRTSGAIPNCHTGLCT